MPSNENQPVMSWKGAARPGTPITALDTRVSKARRGIPRVINRQVAVPAAIARATKLRPKVIVLFPFGPSNLSPDARQALRLLRKPGACFQPDHKTTDQHFAHWPGIATHPQLPAKLLVRVR